MAAHLGRAFTLGLVMATAVMTTGAPALAAPPTAGAAGFGPNVTVFDPGTPVATIQSALDTAFTAQDTGEGVTGRRAFLFKPGTYGTAEQPLQFKLGYYTEVAGLGASPGDVVINGKVEVLNRCTAYGCVATSNHWRTLSNLSIKVTGGPDEGCRANTNFWAVAQAASLRRVNVDGGFSLMDYCSAGPQYAGGGFIADSKLPNVVNGSQQQWFTRDSEIAGWSNGVWNQVFSGVVGAPAESAFPNPPYTTLEKTPASREKPYLFVDAKGAYNVRVPSARRGSRGVTWATGQAPGRTIPIRDFYVAKPSDSVQVINFQLARGKHLLLTPGVYDVARTIAVRRPNTVVLGLGHATLTAVNGSTPLAVDDVPGVVVAGVTVDAGPRRSGVLLQVGGGFSRGSAANPTTLSDVYLRVGGPHPGKVDTALRIDSDHVILDNTRVWRADDQGWTTTVGRYGVVVNGDDVTATGLSVEHFQRHNTLWNGQGGTTVMYQSELPGDVPSQADWMSGRTKGWAGYKVGDRVRTHRLFGAGVYVGSRVNAAVHTANGFEVPKTRGVRLHHVLTVSLRGIGAIDHVVNGVGGPVGETNVDRPVFVSDYPAM
ncbi:adenylyl cyclase [Herbidospora sp. RD11066]